MWYQPAQAMTFPSPRSHIACEFQFQWGCCSVAISNELTGCSCGPSALKSSQHCVVNITLVIVWYSMPVVEGTFPNAIIFCAVHHLYLSSLCLHRYMWTDNLEIAACVSCLKNKRYYAISLQFGGKAICKATQLYNCNLNNWSWCPGLHRQLRNFRLVAFDAIFLAFAVQPVLASACLADVGPTCFMSYIHFLVEWLSIATPP